MNKNIQMNDLERFIMEFEPSKFKLLSRGVEIRGIKDLDRSIALARQVIEVLKLQLTVSCSGEMAMYGSFEVIFDQQTAN